MSCSGPSTARKSLEFNSDTAFSTGDLAGQGAPTLPVSGSFDVTEFFTEVRIPIAQDSWVHDFTVTGGYRYSDYSTGANTDTYKIEGEFAPIRDIRSAAVTTGPFVHRPCRICSHRTGWLWTARPIRAPAS
jgi:iron complex outermembrane recepter protein